MLKRPHFIALSLVVVLTLVTLGLPQQTATRLKLGIGSLFLGLFGLVSAGHQVTGQVADSVVPRRQLLKENEDLRRQIQQMKLQQMQAEEIGRENERLRRQVGWRPQKPWNLRLCRVISQEPANWWRTVQIDLGSREGLNTNMPVLTMEGLVGRVSSVSLLRSQVVLLGDPNCRVSAVVEDETRDTGIIGPAGALESEFVELGFLSKNTRVKPGQLVKTSGNSSIFPAGLLIGTVMDTRSVESGLAAAARVKLAANLRALEEVWVLVNP